jgi:hypothetical protein
VLFRSPTNNSSATNNNSTTINQNTDNNQNTTATDNQSTTNNQNTTATDNQSTNSTKSTNNKRITTTTTVFSRQVASYLQWVRTNVGAFDNDDDLSLSTQVLTWHLVIRYIGR